MTAPVFVVDIVAHVAREFGLTPDEIKGDRRQKRVAEARFAAAWLARRHTRATISGIGRMLGGRVHATVRHSILRGEQLRAESPRFRLKTDALDAMLRAA